MMNLDIEKHFSYKVSLEHKFLTNKKILCILIVCAYFYMS